MKHFLVVVDMQKDFVDGALGTKEAVAIVPKVIEKIRNFDGELFVTYDTHFDDYLDSAEGKKLPVPHCLYGTPGWELADGVREAVEELPHVKEKFYKANQKVGGSGIGLAVADEIMNLHHGSLDIESGEGVGTTVTLTFPVYKEGQETTRTENIKL